MRIGQVLPQNIVNADTDDIYELADGVALHQNEDGFFLLRNVPLSLIRVNAAAFELLKRCDGQTRLSEARAGADSDYARNLLDQLVRLGYVRARRQAHATPTPTVSVVVPVRNRPRQIKECVDSLLSLDYPKEKLEIIVVDDGSEDETPQVLADLPIKAILRPSRSGAAACRNLGWQAARGELIAFTDSDCRADAGWLKELIERMSMHDADAIGGLVKSAGTGSRIDQYESVRSPLYSGKQEKEITADSAISYLPTCNLIVKKDVLEQVSGFDLAFPLAVGEDVDLVWRIVDSGRKVLYTPVGGIVHNHRESLVQFTVRRAQYAASEAQLVRKHPRRGRVIVLPIFQTLFLIFVAVGLLQNSIVGFGMAMFALLFQAALSRRRLARAHHLVGWSGVALALVRSHLGFVQYLLWTMSQYYVLPLLIVASVLSAWSSLPPTPAFGGLLALFVATAVMAYLLDRPALDPLSFVAIFCLEKLAFQAGALGGCFKHRTPRTLLPRLRMAW